MGLFWNQLSGFFFEKFLALGNLVDLFIDRGYGFNLDPQRKEDAGFIDFIELLNGILIDVGYLKPTMMLAVMGLKKMETIFYHHWTPEFCIRIPDIH